MSALAPVDAAPKFTIGPWTCFYKPKYDEWHVSLPMTGGSMKLSLCPDGIQSENREADARLIAAAPDMYEALQKIVDMNVQYAIDRYGDASKAETMCCVTVARAALSKANPHLPSGAAACSADTAGAVPPTVPAGPIKGAA